MVLLTLSDGDLCLLPCHLLLLLLWQEVRAIVLLKKAWGKVRNGHVVP